MSDLRAPVQSTAVTLTFTFSGEIDSLTAPAIEEAAAVALRGGASRVVIDLREVTFCDSQGLNALVGAQRLLRREGVGLQLSGTPRQVRRLLELAGLDEVFTVG